MLAASLRGPKESLVARELLPRSHRVDRTRQSAETVVRLRLPYDEVPALRRSAIVLAPHPDDEVLGCAGVLATRPTTVVHVTDGVPPWAPVQSVPTLVTRRIEECEAAWSVLQATVTRVSLHHQDARLFLNLPRLVDDLIALFTTATSSDVLVPAYERGHPDHDTVHVAVQLARRHVPRQNNTWIGYSLYALDPSGATRFGFLDPIDYPHLPVDPGSVSLGVKRRAIREFSSQISAGSILTQWLGNSASERYGQLPHWGTPLPILPCLYERRLTEVDDGIQPETVDNLLRSSLAAPTSASGEAP
jgi:LmbE family N-acetylglucosaminyl deacetylase